MMIFTGDPTVELPPFRLSIGRLEPVVYDVFSGGRTASGAWIAIDPDPLYPGVNPFIMDVERGVCPPLGCEYCGGPGEADGQGQCRGCGAPR